MGATNMNETMLKGASYVSFAENNHYQELLVSTSSWSNKSAVTELISVFFTTKNVLSTFLLPKITVFAVELLRCHYALQYVRFVSFVLQIIMHHSEPNMEDIVWVATLRNWHWAAWHMILFINKVISETGCDDHLEIETCMLMHKYTAKNPFLGTPKCSIWFFSKTPKTTFLKREKNQ